MRLITRAKPNHWKLASTILNTSLFLKAKAMEDTQIKKALAQLGSPRAREREDAWIELKPLGVAVVPLLAKAYSETKRREGRIGCVFHSIKFARVSEASFQLGLTALKDRATLVRYRACALLAYSLRTDAIPFLKPLLNHVDPATSADARAAIDSITNQNHHYFIDRRHSGKSFWEVNPGDT